MNLVTKVFDPTLHDLRPRSPLHQPHLQAPTPLPEKNNNSVLDLMGTNKLLLVDG